MNQFFPARYSRLEPLELARLVQHIWNLPRITRCIFFHSGENDGYRLEQPDEPLFLRAYRLRYSDSSRVKAELELLDAMKRCGAKVSAPIYAANGELFHCVQAVEGIRAIAVFDFAPGKMLSRNSPDGWDIFGRELALLHQTTPLLQDQARSLRNYSLLDLLSEPADRWIKRLNSMSLSTSEVRRISDQLSSMIEPLWLELPVGIVHGDTAGGNAHVDDNGSLTWFDFMWTGIAPFVWDIATFRRGAGEIEANWVPFLAGYESVRKLNECELRAVPILAAIRNIFVTDIIINECDSDLHAEATPSWFQSRLDELKRLVDRIESVS